MRRCGHDGRDYVARLVLPVGGIKEKVLAAHRAGLKTVILPKRNEVDLDDLPDEVRDSLKFVLAERVEQVVGCLAAAGGEEEKHRPESKKSLALSPKCSTQD